VEEELPEPVDICLLYLEKVINYQILNIYFKLIPHELDWVEAEMAMEQ